MKFSVCLVLLVALWQASAQAPGDESSRCVNQRGPYPPNTIMLMDSRNYEQLITGSSAVWQSLNMDGTGGGVSGCVMETNILFIHLRKKLCSYSTCCLFIIICLYTTCSGEAHLVVCVLLNQGHVISERVHHKITGSSHSISAILMPQKCL